MLGIETKKGWKDGDRGISKHVIRNTGLLRVNLRVGGGSVVRQMATGGKSYVCARWGPYRRGSPRRGGRDDLGANSWSNYAPFSGL